MEFSIVAPGTDELQFFDDHSVPFPGYLLPNAQFISGKAHFGEIIFQHYTAAGFEIWFSNYNILHDTILLGKANIPVLELHIQFQNQLNVSWDGTDENMIRPYQYNLSFIPFVNNKVSLTKNACCYTFDIHFTFDFLSRFLSASAELSIFLNRVIKNEASNLASEDRFLTPRMIAVVNQVLQTKLNGSLNHFFIECKVIELLTLVFDQVAENHPLSPVKLSISDINKLHEAREILLADFEENITLPILARKVTMNEYKLKKGFKHLFGTTVFGYRHTARMEKAKLLILETSIPLIDIAYMSGFNHVSNFQKAFKSFCKLTPAEFKKFAQK